MKYLLLLLALAGCASKETKEATIPVFVKTHEKCFTDQDFYQHVYHFCETVTNEGHPERAPGTQFVKCLRSWGY